MIEISIIKSEYDIKSILLTNGVLRLIDITKKIYAILHLRVSLQ